VSGPQPVRQPPAEDLRNALAMLDAWRQLGTLPRDATAALNRAAQLLRTALAKLAEPTHATTRALGLALPASALVRPLEWREARDVAAVVLHAQLERGE